jgi:hypothetical protein
MSNPDQISSPWDVPAPVLLNTWKHHAGAIRHQIAQTIRTGVTALPDLAGQVAFIGTDLMDLYVGELSPAEIAGHVLARLRDTDHLPLPAFRTWLHDNGGYQLLTLVADQSSWVLRLGVEADRYVHVHPARGARNTRRVRANVLKTAILVLAYGGIHGGDPQDVQQVDHVRRTYLGLSPMGKEVKGEQGLASLLAALRTA